jgi:uncharacterized protein
VAGQLDFSLVGIVASMVTPLAKAGIPVFVVSAFNSDYVLVKTRDFERASAALRAAGHCLITEDRPPG